MDQGERIKGESMARSGHGRAIQQVFPNLNLLGLGVWWAWIWLCYQSMQVWATVPEPSATSVRAMYLASTLAIGLTMTLAAPQWQVATKLVDNRAAIVAVSAVAGVATALLPLALTRVGTWLFVVMAALTGAATSVLCLRAGRIYGRLPLMDMIVAGGLSLVVASTVYLAGMSLSGVGALVFVAVQPLVSGLLMCLEDYDPFEGAPEGAPRLSPAARGVYARLVAVSAIIAIVSGVCRGIGANTWSAEYFARVGMTNVELALAIAAAMLVWVSFGRPRVVIKGIYLALMFMGIVVMLVSCLGYGLELMSMGKELLWLLFSCIIAYLAFRFGASVVRIYAAGQAAYFLCSTLGWAVGGAIGQSYMEQPVHIGVGITLALMLVVAVSLVFRITDIDALFTREGRVRAVDGPGSSAGDADAVSDEQVEAAQIAGAGPDLAKMLVDKYGLSAREVEIMELFARGRSANWIADELYISKNTVRSHLRAVYVKLDVHTRSELVDKLESLG